MVGCWVWPRCARLHAPPRTNLRICVMEILGRALLVLGTWLHAVSDMSSLGEPLKTIFLFLESRLPKKTDECFVGVPKLTLALPTAVRHRSLHITVLPPQSVMCCEKFLHCMQNKRTCTMHNARCTQIRIRIGHYCDSKFKVLVVCCGTT
mmetsp:Transcript_21581/g.49821  ORF Transcript_21581/g.49821 Transcript_21581/m.49821 type:complete len:150 (+) Transcript_21581:1040-1489(+)